MDVKFHFLKDCVDRGQIVIEFVETGQQLADVLTKPLGRLRLTELKKMISMEGGSRVSNRIRRRIGR